MRAGGAPALFKQGTRTFSGKHAVVLKDIEACKALFAIARTSFGPHGMKKMVINRHDRLFVTSDAATIMQELEVEHPAAKILVMACNSMQQEVGDGSNFVLILAGELLVQAGTLIQMGLHTTDITRGYALASQRLLQDIGKLTIKTENNLHSKEALAAAMISAISSKQSGNEEFLSKLVAEACAVVMPENPINFVVDNVRVVKLSGGSLEQSHVIHGMVLPTDVEGDVKSKHKCKIAIFNESVDTLETETKGTVRLTSAQELLDYNLGEERYMEKIIKGLKDIGTDVIFTGGKFGEMALHFIEKFGMMAIRVPSKYDLRRIAKTVRGRMNVQLGPIRVDDLGYADEVYVKEIGLEKIVVVNRDKNFSSVSTIVLRSSTENSLNDLERAINDGINVVKAMTKDARFVAGAGAAEIEMSRLISKFGDSCSGLEQYAVKKFAESFEVFPRTLAENSGVNASEFVSSLYAAHERGEINAGIDVERGAIRDSVSAGIVDLLVSKVEAIKLATNAVNTVLRVDQIIMAKPAGGPKMKPSEGHWDDD